jgi:hypothetical protein
MGVVTGSAGEPIEDRRTQDSIDALIRAENNAGVRELLIVLQNINLSLIANTIATKQTQSSLTKHMGDFNVLVDNFSKHTFNEEAIMNRGRGMWSVLAFVLTMVQGLAIYGWHESRNEIKTLQDEVRSAEITHQKLQNRIELLEKL